MDTNEIEETINRLSQSYYDDVKQDLMRDFFYSNKSQHELFRNAIRNAFYYGFCQGMDFEK